MLPPVADLLITTPVGFGVEVGVAVGVEVSVAVGVAVGVKVEVGVGVALANGFGMESVALHDRIASTSSTTGVKKTMGSLSLFMAAPVHDIQLSAPAQKPACRRQSWQLLGRWQQLDRIQDVLSLAPHL